MAVYPTLKTFQWSRPSAPNPRLASPISATDTTFVFTSPPLDENDTVITEAFLMGVKNSEGYTETIYVPDGGLSADGLIATGVTRGIDLAGTDWTTGDSNLAAAHNQDSPVYCNVSAVHFALWVAAFQGVLASGANTWRVGDETDSDIYIYAQNADGNKPYFKYDKTTNVWVFSNDGTSGSEAQVAGGVSPTGGDGVTVTGGQVTIDLIDTTTFVSTSAGAGDAGKAPVLNGSGLLDSSFVTAIPVEKLLQNNTFGESISVGDVVSINYDGELEKATNTVPNDSANTVGFSETTASSGSNNWSSFGPLISKAVDAPQASAEAETGTGNTFSANTANAWPAILFDTTSFDTFSNRLSKITLLDFYSVGSPTGNVSIDLYSVSGSEPATKIQTLATFDIATLSSTTTNDETIEFTSKYTCAASTEYAIVLDVSACTLDASNYFKSTYSAGSGNFKTTTDAGTNWTDAGTPNFTLYTEVPTADLFLGTSGAVSTSPGATYRKPVGKRYDDSTIMLRDGQPFAKVTYSYTGGAATETVDTELELGFRPLTCTSWQTSNVGIQSFGMADLNGYSMCSWGANIAIASTNYYASNGVEGYLGYYNEKLNTSDTDYHTVALSAIASADSITMRRVITETGTSTDRTYNVYLNIYGA